MEYQHKFQQVMFAANVNFNKAFLVVLRKALKGLRFHEIFAEIIALLTDMNSWTVSALKCGDGHIQLLSCDPGNMTGLRQTSITLLGRHVDLSFVAHLLAKPTSVILCLSTMQ